MRKSRNELRHENRMVAIRSQLDADQQTEKKNEGFGLITKCSEPPPVIHVDKNVRNGGSSRREWDHRG